MPDLGLKVFNWSLSSILVTGEVKSEYAKPNHTLESAISSKSSMLGAGIPIFFLTLNLPNLAFFSTPLASKILFGFFALFSSEFGFFLRQSTSAIIVYLCTISVQNFSNIRRKLRLES